MNVTITDDGKDNTWGYIANEIAWKRVRLLQTGEWDVAGVSWLTGGQFWLTLHLPVWQLYLQCDFVQKAARKK